MIRTFSIGFGTVLLVWQAIVTVGLAADAASVAEGLTSTKDHGVISVMSEPTFADGRLVLKVVAMNRMQGAASFGPEAVKVFTAACPPVNLMSLAQLLPQPTATSHDGAVTGTQVP